MFNSKRFQKLAGILNEGYVKEQEIEAKTSLYDDEEEFPEEEDDFEGFDDKDDDFIPGASAYGHGGEWEDYFDDATESSNYSEMTIRDLKDQGLSDEEILDIIKNTK